MKLGLHFLALSFGFLGLTACDHRSLNTQTNPNSVESASAAQIAVHNSETNCWIIIENSVYNVTNFISLHPGGRQKIVSYCGKEATEAFNSVGHSQNAVVKLGVLLVAKLALGLIGEEIEVINQ